MLVENDISILVLRGFFLFCTWCMLNMLQGAAFELQFETPKRDTLLSLVVGDPVMDHSNGKVLIQVLYGSHWLTILDFGTKTRCGGFPMCPATEELFKRKKILANHGTQFKTISIKMDAASLILKGLVIEDVAREETASERRWREYKESEAILGGVVEDDPEPDENEEYLFYTAEEFEELIKCITAQEKLKAHYADRLPYTRRMTPVPMWCEMARSALPVNTEEIWMSEDQEEIDDVTNRLVVKQKELRALYRDVIVKTFTNIPDELARLIAEFSGPVALDVRVAFKDDEEQSNELIKAAQKDKRLV
eukprot:gene26246-28699_t